MFRSLLCWAALAALAPSVWAGQTTTPAETVIRLSVSPQAAPRPALRYLLLPELKELQPGNPIPNYLKGLLDQDFTREQSVLGPAALRQADRAARLDKPDWQILLKVKTDGIGLLLPDLQKMRELAAALQERFHDEVARGRFDDALYTARTMFAMSRHMGEHPTLIGDLVGMAIAFVTITPLEEMIGQPGCPNLYWALTNLPSPLVSMDRGLEGERVLIQAEFHDLSDRTPMSAAQLKKLITHLDKLRAFDNKPGRKTTWEWLGEKLRDPAPVGAARRRLVGFGLPEQRLLRFPAIQVLFLDEKLAFEVGRDEAMKLMKLPMWQVEALIGPLKRPKDDRLFGFLVPALIKVRRAQGRLEQRIALLRHVEALRMYASAHGGKLPKRLADCPVPLPDDPFTGKPFRYQLDGATAHLRGSPPPGEARNPAYNLHYEITIRK